MITWDKPRTRVPASATRDASCAELRERQIAGYLEHHGFDFLDSSDYPLITVNLIDEIVEYEITGCCNFVEKAAFLPFNRLASDTAYLLCLHEAGHLAHLARHSDDHEYYRMLLDCEAEAWIWALNHYVGEITDDLYQIIWSYLRTYACFLPLHTAGANYHDLISRLGKNGEAARVAKITEQRIREGKIVITFSRILGAPDWYRLLRSDLSSDLDGHSIVF